jgi:DNA-binding transcriptional MerR regulator
MKPTDVPIGAASTQSGVKVPTIRYYEGIGLLPAPSRTKSNRRRYSASDLRRLVFIRNARQLGFEIEAIRHLLALQDYPQRSCKAAAEIARARLAEVEHRINILTALRGELERMISECALNHIAACRVIEVLGTSGNFTLEDQLRR